MVCKYFSRLSLALGAALVASAAHAQWPERPITWVVPFAAGGPMDVVSRPVAKRMSELLGVPIVVENRAGAGGTVGIAAIARARPDGHTIGIASIGTQAIAPNLNQNVAYDPNASFSPVGLLGRYVNVLVVNAKSDIASVQDLVAQARKPEGLAFGSAGNGSSNHLSGELLRLLTSASYTHVPYRGSAPALTDLLGGNIAFMFDTLNTSMSHIKSGALKALAVTSPERSRFLSQTPTMDEAGVKGYADTGSELWWGVVAPAGLPADVLRRLNQALVQALESDEIAAQFEQQFVDAWPSTPEAFAEVVRQSHASWGKIIRDAKISVN